MIYSFGGRVDNDSNAITKIDEENRTAETKGYVNGEYVEFDGGGLSDFSMAEVTIVNNTGNTLSNWGLPVCISEGDNAALIGMYTGAFPSGTSVHNVPLYKGVCMWSLNMPTEYQDFDISIDGDATKTGGVVTITGDCAIMLELID